MLVFGESSGSGVLQGVCNDFNYLSCRRRQGNICSGIWSYRRIRSNDWSLVINERIAMIEPSTDFSG